MAETIKDLLDKIHEEGIQAAQTRAAAIESEAKLQAQALVQKAQAQAKQIIEEAKQSAQKLEQTTKVGLQQAGRDTLLELRRQINRMLDALIKQQAASALSPQELAGIIAALAQQAPGQDVVVSLSAQDKTRIEQGFLAQLKEQVKKDIVLKASDDISAGLVISFDAGRSQFEFTDKALVEYIGGSLKPKLAAILNEGQSTK